MAKKKKAAKPQREWTKHELSQWERQQRRQRLTLILGIIIIVAAVLIVGVGWMVTDYVPMHSTVIKVNDREFNMKYYMQAIMLQGLGKTTEYLQYISDTVLTDIERQELVRQAALKLGISVTDDEVKEKLESDKLPTNPLEMDIVVAELLWDKMLDEHFEYVVPTSAEQRHVMAMLLESESSAAEIRDRLEEGEDFMELAAEYSLDSQLETYQGNYSWHPEEVLEELLTASSKPVEYAFLPDVVGELSQPLHDEGVYKSLGYWLIEVLERDEEGEQVHVQGILLGNEEEAQEVRAKLEDGADFAEIAVEYSQYPAVESNKGDLRWIAKGDRGSSFDEFAFNPDIELGTLSEPVRDETAYTQGGYWLVKVIDENDDMPITAEDREIMKSKAMNEWADSLFDNPEYVIDEGNLDEEKKAWALERARKELEKAEKASS